MRTGFAILPLLLLAAPAVAQAAPAPADATAAPPALTLPPELTDPRMTDRLVDMMQVMSKSFLDLPIGEMQAAVEGRAPTRADRRRTVGSESRLGERQLHQQLEQAKPAMRAGMRAMAAALPAMIQSMSKMADELKQATANLPQPGYPNR